MMNNQKKKPTNVNTYNHNTGLKSNFSYKKIIYPGNQDSRAKSALNERRNK